MKRVAVLGRLRLGDCISPEVMTISSGPKLLVKVGMLVNHSKGLKNGKVLVQGEGRVYHAVEQCTETASCARHKIFLGRAGVFPQRKVKRIMGRPATKEENRCQDEQADDGKDLDRGEPEFRLGICADWEEIKGHNDNDHEPAGNSNQQLTLLAINQPKTRSDTHVIQTAMLMVLGQ